MEQAVRREMMEEVNLDLYELKQFHVFSDPKKDFRHHFVEITHFAKATDEAAEAFIVKLKDIPMG